MAFNNQEVLNEYKKELDRLRQRDIHNQSFERFKKEYGWAAQEFDKKINSFYDENIKSVIKEIKLPKEILDEISYFNMITEKMTETDFVNNIDTIFYNFKKMDSVYIGHLEELRWKIKSHPDLLIPDWYNDFLKNWNFFLTKRIVDFRLKSVENLRYDYLVDIYDVIKKYTRYVKVYKTLYDVFGTKTDVKEELRSPNINAVEKFADFMYKDPSILKIAELLGRLNGEDEKMEINITKEITHYYDEEMLPYNPEEIVGLTESKDLEHVVPAELSYLFNPVLETIFFKKFAENKLQTFLFNSKERVLKETFEDVEYEAPIPLEQGPFIICVDTSSSMEGPGEYVSKALVLAICKVALKEKRDIMIINFANKDVDSFRINKNSLELNDMMKFLSKSFYGPTNAVPAFEMAVNYMKQQDFKRADLLVVSDFMAAKLSNSTIEKINELKVNYNRFHSLIVGTMPNVEFQEVFDNVMYYDPDDPLANQQIIKSLNETLRNLKPLSDEELEFRNSQIKELNETRITKQKRQRAEETPKVAAMRKLKEESEKIRDEFEK